MLPALEPSGYRVQTKLMVGGTRRLVLGLYAPGSHRVVDASGCPLHHPLLQRAIPAIRDALADEAVPLHGRGRTGVRYVLVRASLAEERVLVTLVSSRTPLPHAERLARRLRTAAPARRPPAEREHDDRQRDPRPAHGAPVGRGGAPRALR